MLFNAVSNNFNSKYFNPEIAKGMEYKGYETLFQSYNAVSDFYKQNLDGNLFNFDRQIKQNSTENIPPLPPARRGGVYGNFVDTLDSMQAPKGSRPEHPHAYTNKNSRKTSSQKVSPSRPFSYTPDAPKANGQPFGTVVSSAKVNAPKTVQPAAVNTKANTAPVKAAETAQTKKTETKQPAAAAATTFNINGNIENFAQGKIGDCWLLSSLGSLSNSKEGQKLLKDAIQINNDGTYTVKFDGVDWEQKITTADLQAARNSGNYSKGDDDVLLMEVAMEKYLTQVKNGQVKSDSFYINDAAASGKDTPLRSGYTPILLDVLKGEGYWQIGNTDAKEGNITLNEFCDSVQNKNGFATIGFKGNNVKLNTINGDTVYTGGTHSWSVKSVDGDKVTLIDPYYVNREVVVTKAELSKYAIDFVYQDLI